jgi:hypothetical protein
MSCHLNPSGRKGNVSQSESSEGHPGPQALAEKAADVETARQEYLTAKTGEEIARKNTTECLNRLNAAQGAFDKLFQDVLAVAPRESNWHTREGFLRRA